jgi:hypothetical protein
MFQRVSYLEVCDRSFVTLLTSHEYHTVCPVYLILFDLVIIYLGEECACELLNSSHRNLFHPPMLSTFIKMGKAIPVTGRGGS